MIRPIVKDTFFLSQPSAPMTKQDLAIVQDLQDTLRANREHCVGMAANMIGYAKRAIIVAMGPLDMVMLNPVITKKEQPYDTEEGCLSLTGVRATTRYDKITVQYEDTTFKKHTAVHTGFTAQIIQHEVDHLEGRVI